MGHSSVSQLAHGRDGKGARKAALELGWPSVALPKPSSRLLLPGSAAGSTRILVFPAGATSRRSPLFSGQEHPVGIPHILSKQEIGAYRLLLNLSAPKQNPLEKPFVPQHARPAFQLLDGDGDNLVDFNEFEATRFLFNIQKEELKIFKVFDVSRGEVELEKLQSKERLRKCP